MHTKSCTAVQSAILQVTAIKTFKPDDVWMKWLHRTGMRKNGERHQQCRRQKYRAASEISIDPSQLTSSNMDGYTNTHSGCFPYLEIAASIAIMANTVMRQQYVLNQRKRD